MRQLSPFPFPANSSVFVRPHGMQELLRAQTSMWEVQPGWMFLKSTTTH